MTFNPYEGVWLDVANQPSPWLIVDGSGNYWLEEQINWLGQQPLCVVYESDAFLADGMGAGPVATDYFWNNPGTGCSSGQVFGPRNLTLTAAPALTLTAHWVMIDRTSGASIPASSVSTWALDEAATSVVPSLATVAGNWKVPDGSIATITADGAFSLHDVNISGVNTNCALTGTVTIADPATNVYTVTAVAATTCFVRGSDIFNGGSALGVFTYDGSGKLPVLHGGITVSNATAMGLLPLDATKT